MKYNDWLTEEVFKILTEATLTPDQGHTSTRNGPYASAGANGPHPVDDLKFKGELPDEEEKKHDSLDEDESFYESLFEEFEASRKSQKSLVSEKKESVNELAQKSSITIPLPRFVPNESWGEPGSADFETIRKFVLKATGAEKDIKKKFAKLVRPFSTDSAVKSPGRMISSMVLIESLASILKSFSESPAGFVFEGFLAALTFGKQIAEKTPTGLPIEDIIAFDPDGPNGVPASLKVLKGRTKRAHAPPAMAAKGHTAVSNAGTGIHGSYQNLVYFFDRYDAIDYIVALKRGQDSDQLQILSFMMTRDNLVDIFFATGNDRLFGDFSSKIKKAKGDWSKLRPLLYYSLRQEWETGEKEDTAKKVRRPQQDDPEGDETFIDKDFDDSGKMREALVQEGKETQWTIEQKDLFKLKGKGAFLREIAILDLSTENLVKQNAIIAEKLGDEVGSLFENVKFLSDNINEYFTSDNREEAKKFYGPDASLAAQDIGEEMLGIVAEEKPEEDGE